MAALPPTIPSAGDAGDDEIQEVAFARRGCNCFWMPCFERSETSPLWERMRSPESRERRWWWRGWTKVREWSEIAAGPKWKTFIRRFNHGGRVRAVQLAKHGSFQYDPLSYALNFDDCENAGAGRDGEDGAGFSFSARFASVPATAKSSMDLGKDAPLTFT